MRTFHLATDSFTQSVGELRAGDRVYLTGTIYTARDAAHRRMHDELDKGIEPFPLKGSIIYYTGPCPGVIGKPIISAGPTTSGRMDVYTPRLLALGITATIGKGPRNSQVKAALVENQAVYLVATGGAGALLAQSIKSYDVVCYPDLGPEAVLALQVDNLPLIVAEDSCGNSIYN